MKLKLINKTLVELRRLFDNNQHLYNLHYDFSTKKIETVKTTFVNAHCIYCLYQLGKKEEALDILVHMMKSKLFDKKTKLFRFSIKDNRILNGDKNTCSNLLMVRSMIALGKTEEAEKLYEVIKTRLYDKKEKLFMRSTRDKELYVAQTNLWGVDALIALGRYEEAKELLKRIIERFFNPKIGLLTSKSGAKKGKYRDNYVFSDDNLLFVYVAHKFFPKLSKQITKTLINSELFDKKKFLFNRSLRLNNNYLNRDKSTYKNAICILGLKVLKHKLARKVERALIENLYNREAGLFIDGYADSNLLACYALSFGSK